MPRPHRVFFPLPAGLHPRTPGRGTCPANAQQLVRFMSIDVSRLDIDLREESTWRRTAVTIPAELVSAERKKVAKTSQRVRIPGFRAGKIPPSVIERFGQALDREMVDRVVEDAYKGALEAKDLKPISEGEISKLEFEPESDPLRDLVRCGAELRAEPPGLQGHLPGVKVGDEELEGVLNRLREQQGAWGRSRRAVRRRATWSRSPRSSRERRGRGRAARVRPHARPGRDRGRRERRLHPRGRG